MCFCCITVVQKYEIVNLLKFVKESFPTNSMIWQPKAEAIMAKRKNWRVKCSLQGTLWGKGRGDTVLQNVLQC